MCDRQHPYLSLPYRKLQVLWNFLLLRFDILLGPDVGHLLHPGQPRPDPGQGGGEDERQQASRGRNLRDNNDLE